MWSRFWEEMNGEMTHKEMHSGCPTLSRALASLTVAREVGEWEDKPHDEDHPEDEEFTHQLYGMDIGLFTTRFGKAFDGYTDRCWWYGIFAMARAMAVGISLGVIADGKTNAGTMMGLFCIDWFVKVFFSPFIDVFELCNEIMTATLETSQIGTILAFTNDWVSASWIENAFQMFSIIGYIPSFFGQITETLASMSEFGPEIMYRVYQIGGSMTCIFTGSRLCFQIATGKQGVGALKDFVIHVVHDCISHEENPIERKQREAREAEEAAARGEIYSSSGDSDSSDSAYSGMSSRSTSFDSSHQGSISKPKATSSFDSSHQGSISKPKATSQASFTSASISSYSSHTASAVLEHNQKFEGSMFGVLSTRAASPFDSYGIITGSTQRSHFNWNAGTAIINYGSDASGQAVVSSRLEYTPRESMSLVPDQLAMPPPRRHELSFHSRLPQQAWAPHAPTVPHAPVPPSQPDPLGRDGSPVPPQAPVPPSQPDPMGRRGSAVPHQGTVGITNSHSMPGVSLVQAISPPPLPSTSNRFRALYSRSLGRRSNLPSPSVVPPSVLPPPLSVLQQTFSMTTVEPVVPPVPFNISTIPPSLSPVPIPPVPLDSRTGVWRL